MSEVDALFDAIADAVVIIDQTGVIRRVNASANDLFGYDADDLIGVNVSVLMPSPHAEQHASYVRRYLADRAPRIIGIGRELTGRRKDGSLFPMRLNVSEIDHLQSFVGVIHDLSEWKDGERRLREIERIATIGGLTSSIVHDMGNIVAAMEIGLA